MLELSQNAGKFQKREERREQLERKKNYV